MTMMSMMITIAVHMRVDVVVTECIVVVVTSNLSILESVWKLTSFSFLRLRVSVVEFAVTLLPGIGGIWISSQKVSVLSLYVMPFIVMSHFWKCTRAVPFTSRVLVLQVEFISVSGELIKRMKFGSGCEIDDIFPTSFRGQFAGLLLISWPMHNEFLVSSCWIGLLQ